jgi:peptidoglycan/LPS O-acetylase OafA/YrhL
VNAAAISADKGPAGVRRLYELDALRGLSALAVALYHFTFYIQYIVPDAPLPATPIWWGCDGVKLFFAISAFAILGALERTHRLRAFASARARRLLPEYWLSMTLTGVIALQLAPASLLVDPVTWLRNIPLMQVWTGTRMVDGVYWSLNVEIGFYVAMAILWRLGATRHIEQMVLGWMAIRLLFWLVPVSPWLQLLALTEYAPYFAIGLIAYRIWTGARSCAAQLPVAGAVLGIVLVTDTARSSWLVLGMIPLFFALATGRMRWLAHPLPLWMGSISYPFYLLHAVIGYAVVVRLEALGAGPYTAALGALVLAAMLATLVANACARWRTRTAPARIVAFA